MGDTQLIADGYLMILGIKQGEEAAQRAAADAGVTMSSRALGVIRAASGSPTGGSADELEGADLTAALRGKIEAEGPGEEVGGDYRPIGTWFMRMFGRLITDIEEDGTDAGHFYRITMRRPTARLADASAPLAVLYSISKLIADLSPAQRDAVFARMNSNSMPSVSAYIIAYHDNVGVETAYQPDGSPKQQDVYTGLDDLQYVVAKAAGKMASQIALGLNTVPTSNERDTYPRTFTVYWPSWDGDTAPLQLDEDGQEFFGDFPAASDFPVREAMPEAPLDAPSEAAAPAEAPPARVDPLDSFPKAAKAPAPLDPLEEKFLVPTGF